MKLYKLMVKITLGYKPLCLKAYLKTLTKLYKTGAYRQRLPQTQVALSLFIKARPAWCTTIPMKNEFNLHVSEISF